MRIYPSIKVYLSLTHLSPDLREPRPESDLTERAERTDLAEEREVRLGRNCAYIDIVRTIDREGRED